MQTVILAAGQGKRMRSALPKVLQPLAHLPLLGHVVRTARALDAARICVVYGHGGDQVRDAFADQPLQWALQAEQHGTGHALMQALPQLDRSGAVLVLYGDVPLLSEATLRRLLEAAGDERLGILTVELPDPSGYGRIVRDTAGHIVRIVEQKDANAQECGIREINTGIMSIPARHLADWLGQLSNDNAQGEYYLTDVVALAVRHGVDIVSVHPERVSETLGVNDKAQLAELERMYQLEQAQRLLGAGVTLRDPARIDIRGELVCGRDVEIDVGCIFEGRVELADGVQVGAYSVLRNVSVGAGTRIAPYCHLDEASVGPVCQLGPYARLRPGTVLGEDVHVGNFVEVKNTRIDAHSKANHLAYVGDATVGSRVNIGAGTITCNYDGANKFRTVIEDDVFIGSDTQLVAPVTVGRGATLAAGTTLTKDAPAGQLTLSRVRQTTVQGWSRPTKKK